MRSTRCTSGRKAARRCWSAWKVGTRSVGHRIGRWGPSTRRPSRRWWRGSAPGSPGWPTARCARPTAARTGSPRTSTRSWVRPDRLDSSSPAGSRGPASRPHRRSGPAWPSSSSTDAPRPWTSPAMPWTGSPMGASWWANTRTASSGADAPQSTRNGCVPRGAGSIDLRNERLVGQRGADVAGLRLARWQRDRLGREVPVGDLREEMGDHVESGPLLVVGADDPPGRLLDVRLGEHLILRLRVVEPTRPRGEVDRRQLPALRRIVDSGGEPAVLLGVADAEPVLGEEDAAAHEHPLQLRTPTQELLVLVFGAEAHHPLDAGAVVPGSVEEDDLAGGREVLHVT